MSKERLEELEIKYSTLTVSSEKNGTEYTEVAVEDLVFLIQNGFKQAERVQELESFIDRFINSLSNNCLKEHVRKYRTDKKLMRTIRRQNEPPSYLSMSDKFALISLTKLFENVAEQNKRYRGALKFYAEESNYDYDVKVDSISYVGDQSDMKFYRLDSEILYDRGEKARKALEGEE